MKKAAKAKKLVSGIAPGHGPVTFTVESYNVVGYWDEVMEFDCESKAMECAFGWSTSIPDKSWRVSKKETRWLHASEKSA